MARVCKRCGWQVNPMTGACYCRIKEAREALGMTKECKRCGKEFEPEARVQKYCSKECALEAKRELTRQSWQRTKQRRQEALKEIVERHCGDKGGLVLVISRQDGRYVVRLETNGQKVEEYEVEDVVVERVERVSLEV